MECDAFDGMGMETTRLWSSKFLLSSYSRVTSKESLPDGVGQQVTDSGTIFSSVVCNLATHSVEK